MKVKRLSFLLAAICVFFHLNAGHAQGTAFTYQGQLTSGGAPANGSFDLTFTLLDASSNGNAIAGPLTYAATAVSNGLFAVTLDFGSGIFTGSNYWLEIAVQTNNGNGFTTLSPRQAIMPTPYAVFTANAGTAQTAASANAVADGGTVPLTALPAAVVTNGATNVTFTGNFIGNGGALTNLKGTNITGAIPLAALPGAAVTNGEANVTLSGTFSGNGSGLTALNASQISTGTIPSAQLPPSPLSVGGLLTNQTTLYATSGVYSLTIPFGASQLMVKLWGAGGGGGTSGHGNSGGGGAFVQKTVAVSPGQTYTIIVGQRGNYGAADLAGNGSGEAAGGNPSQNNQVAGQGGQASSFFYLTSGNYVLDAMAGGGGAGGTDTPGGAGGNPGVSAVSPLYGVGSGAVGGANGQGGAGGATLNSGGYYSGDNGGAGANTAANITTVGVASLSSVGGTGGIGASNPNIATGAGGGGGGYGGGGAGAVQYANYGAAVYGGGGAGGGSYGDSIIIGNGTNAGNITDANYVYPGGTGGLAGHPGSDGMAVVIIEGPQVNIAGTVAATAFTANSSLTINGGIYLNNATSNAIQFDNAGVAPPSNDSAGWKLRTWGQDYGIGIDSFTQWYAAGNYHRWYADNGSGAFSKLMELNNSGALTVYGNLSATGAVTFEGGGQTIFNGLYARGGAPGANGVNNNGYAFRGSGDTDSGMFSLADGQLAFYINSGVMETMNGAGISVAGGVTSQNGGGLSTYDRSNGNDSWTVYANAGRLRFWDLSQNADQLSIDTSGTLRSRGSVLASASPDLAETIPGASDVEAGDIVCADPQHPESVIRCDKNGRGILGVISDGSGGFLINARAAYADAPLTGKPLVLAGRVPVKVSLENGPIHIGDMLAPSSHPGVAMRSNGDGPEVGIALDDFGATNSQRAMVLCFVKATEGGATLKELKEKAAKVDALEKRVTDLEELIRRLAK